jgi:hypothetical protein
MPTGRMDRCGLRMTITTTSCPLTIIDPCADRANHFDFAMISEASNQKRPVAMGDALQYVGLFWLAINATAGGMLMALILARTIRRKRQLHASFVTRLMTAHRQTHHVG